MQNYIALMKDILENGIDLPDRTGVGRKKVFGRMLRFNVSGGKLPLVTTRYINFDAVVNELFWFRDGGTNVATLPSEIWNQWAVAPAHIEAFVQKFLPDDPDAQAYVKEGLMAEMVGEVGSMYGEAWRSAPQRFYNAFYPQIKEADVEPARLARIKEQFSEQAPVNKEGEPISFEDYLQYSCYQTIDQLQEVLLNLKKRPFSSRHVISAWIPDFIPFEALSPQENVLMGKGALAPCHVLQQYLVFPPAVAGGKNRLSLMMTQRSSDFAVGVPFNLAQYALLLMLVAQVSDMEPFEFVWSSGDTHLYFDQVEQAEEQILREPKASPVVVLDPSITSLFDFKPEHIQLLNYDPHPKINYPVAV